MNQYLAAAYATPKVQAPSEETLFRRETTLEPLRKCKGRGERTTGHKIFVVNFSVS